jgi:hypothetical protein
MFLKHRRSAGALAGMATGVLTVLALARPVDAQIVPGSTTTTTAPQETSTTTTTALLPSSTTTTAPVTTTTSVTTSTTAPGQTTTSTVTRRTTTTRPGPTTTAFVPPSGVRATTTVPVDTGPLDADTGLLPFFVMLSLGGFAVAVAIVTVQWIKTRPR